MRIFKTMILTGLISTFALADVPVTPTNDSNGHKIRYECDFHKRGGKGGGVRCEVKGRICLDIGGLSAENEKECREGITTDIECSDGFELWDRSIDVYFGIIAPPNRKIITYAKDGHKEAYVHLNIHEIDRKGIEARLTTIWDDEDATHLRGHCDIENGWDRAPAPATN